MNEIPMGILEMKMCPTSTHLKNIYIHQTEVGVQQPLFCWNGCRYEVAMRIEAVPSDAPLQKKALTRDSYQ